MSVPDKLIILFYKRVMEVGGAERLLLQEYLNFKKAGCTVKIVVYEVRREALFSYNIDKEDIIELGSGGIFRLIGFCRRYSNACFLCASGHIDLYIASLFSSITYSLHIHHPSSMSLNEFDKYSWFLRHKFEELVKFNYGAKKFIAEKQKAGFAKLLFYNIRTLFSYPAIKKAKEIFVLSEFARREKQFMYGVSSHALCGGVSRIGKPEKNSVAAKYVHYKRKILSISRLSKGKRLDIVIRGFAGYLKAHPGDAVLLIGGTGKEKENLVSIAKELQIEESVIFLGFVPEEELYDYYALADLFVVIDWADYVITVFEALSVETKVLVSSESDYDKALVKSGYIFSADPEPEEVMKGFERALSAVPAYNKAELYKLLQEYTWESYCNKILGVLFK